MTFARRRISVTIQLGVVNQQANQLSQFAESGTNTVTIPDLRTRVRARNVGAAADSSATIEVWGMTPSLMNQLSTLGLAFNIVPKNTLTVSAGDASGTSTAYTGTIFSAYGDYQAQPDVYFRFDCKAGAIDAAASIPPTSVRGSQMVADVMSGLARQMGRTFLNFGVTATAPQNLYLRGGALTQAQQLARWAGIFLKDDGVTLSIFPRGGNTNQQGQSVPVISPETGMIKYPVFTQQGIIVSTLFNPQISFGSLVEVRSGVLSGIAGALAAAGNKPFPTRWAVNKLDLALDARFPKGEWKSTVYGYNPGSATGQAGTILPPRS